jgi:uroporphyrinogen-III synthase
VSKILITRPKNLSEQIAQKLAKKNIESVIQPLFQIVEIDDLNPVNLQPQAIIITSSASICALEKLGIRKTIPILSVGEVTSSNLKKIGYNNILSASNSASSLLELSLEKLNKNSGEIIYLSGELITLDLASKLQEKGFKARRIITYTTEEIKEFSLETIDKIKKYEIKEVWLYSKNSTKIFHKLIKKHNLVEYLDKLKIVFPTELI